MTQLLDIVSKIGTFMVLFSLFYFMYNYLCEYLLKLNKFIIFKRVQLSDAISISLSLITIFKFIQISSPYA